MKASIQYISMLAVAFFAFTACEKDDTDFSSYTNKSTTTTESSDDSSSQTSGSTATVSKDTIYIAWSGTSATVTNDQNGYVSTSNGDVTVNTQTSTDNLVLVLSGSTTDGSLLVYREQDFTIVFNGVSIHNNDGPAVNNQCTKALYIKCADGTSSTLSDGTSYATQEYDQKGALFSEGEIYFAGEGTLNVTGSSKNAIASDDFITIDDNITLYATSTASNGVKANDGVFINGGSLYIEVSAAAARGIRSEGNTTITGGSIVIKTSGDCEYDTEAQDYNTAACIKSDLAFTMSGGDLTMTSTGDGGKCINCSEDIIFSGGTLSATTTGSNNNGKPKAIKSDTGIIVSGGSFTAQVSKSSACDNGTDSDDPADMITVKGSPTTKTIEKKNVVIKYE